MALTPEDGTGLAGADSYQSQADITTYLASYNPSTAWVDLDSDAKDQIARRTTQSIEAMMVGRWPGSLKTRTQALAWPRINACDAYGRSLASDAVPQYLKWAHAEACKLAAEGYELTPDRRSTDVNKTRELVKIGPLTFDDLFDMGGQGVDRFERFDMLIGLVLDITAPRTGGSVSALSMHRG